MVSKLTKDSFKITASNGTTTTVKSIESGSDNFITVTTYNNFSYIGQLFGQATVVCVAAKSAVNTNFTITGSSSEPNYKLANYSDNRKTTTGANVYAHFRGIDKWRICNEALHNSNQQDI